jgi:hypothetical protein
MRDVTVVDRESKLWNHYTVEKIPVLQQYWKPPEKYEGLANGEWRDVPVFNAVDIEL